MLVVVHGTLDVLHSNLGDILVVAGDSVVQVGGKGGRVRMGG